MGTQPNIVWIYCDELRADALACYGHEYLPIQTPNLDKLAESGVRFTNHFCNSPICVSSRACTLTGMYCEDIGFYSNEGAWPNFRLPHQVDTFPQVLSRNGYATANFGKIHIPSEMYQNEDTSKNVFQVNNEEGGGMGFWTELGDEGVQMIRAPSGGMQGGVYPANEPYPPDAVARNAMAWISATEGPFLARISLLQPHTPVIPPAYCAAMYIDDVPVDFVPAIPEGLSEYEKQIGRTHDMLEMDPVKYRMTIAHYYAQVAWIDDQIGLIIDYLTKEGLLEDTIIIFGADHGKALGETGGYEKHGFMPAVHRVPFIMSCPATLPEGKVDETIGEDVDMARTLFDLAGIESPDQFKGRSLISGPPPEAVYGTIGHGRPFSKMGPNGGRGEWIDGRGWPRRSCVRSQQWRYEKNMLIDSEQPTGKEHIDAFLCDYSSDPKELTNRTNDPALADIEHHLASLLDEHAEGSLDVPDSCLIR